MKFSILLISIIIIIPFSTQLQTQIFTTTTTPLSKPTQVDSETTQFTLGTDFAKRDQNAPIWLANMHSLSSKSLSTTLLVHRLLQRDAMRRTDSLSAEAAAAGINGTVYSGASQGSSGFLMRIGFGTPAKLMQVLIDTGSDSIWIQCKPCTRCYQQPDPIFDPNESNSSSKVLCGSMICPTPNTTCSKKKTCPYEISYADGSYSTGDYMTETLTFRGSPVKKILFGCGHDNAGLLDGVDGLLGLGWGNTSFMGQAGRNFSHVFSYCLVGLFSQGKSYIMFGPTAVSRKAVFTPLIRNRILEGAETFYYVALKGISVGGVRVTFPKGVFDMDEQGGGGVIIDSGTPVTWLALPAYMALRNAFRDGSTHLNRTLGYSILDTCYDLSRLKSAKLPTVVLHFEGADMKLPSNNYLIPLKKNGTTKFCFAFAGTTDGLSVIGSIQQQGFQVSYDWKRERLGLAPRSCRPVAN